MFPIRPSAFAFAALLVLATASTGRCTGNHAQNSPEKPVPVLPATGSVVVAEPAHTCITYEDGSKWVDSLCYIKNDTTFLYHCTWTEKGEPYYIKAFIVRDRLSKPFRYLYRHSTLRTLDTWNAEQLRMHLELLRESQTGPLPVHDLDGCPGTWIPLSTLRGKHYVDLLRYDPVWITDSLYIQQYMDGPLPGRIEEFSHPSPAHYHLRTVGPTDPEPGKQVDIHLIDPVRQIAVIVFRTRDVEYGMLYGSLERIDQFDLVDWNWNVPDALAGDEIAWDEIDCLALVPQEERRTEKASSGIPGERRTEAPGETPDANTCGRDKEVPNAATDAAPTVGNESGVAGHMNDDRETENQDTSTEK